MGNCKSKTGARHVATSQVCMSETLRGMAPVPTLTCGAVELQMSRLLGEVVQ